jgi:hypothetical protein
VASFDVDAAYAHPADFDLLRDVPVSLFQRDAVLSGTVESLREIGYWIVEVDAGNWDADGMFAAVARAFDFPDYFGNNLDAVNDCLSDVAEGQYGWPREAAGLAVVVRGYDTFWTRDRDLAQALVDIGVRQSRYGLLFGHRILWLLQVSDRPIAMDPVGCQVPRRSSRDEASHPDSGA